MEPEWAKRIYLQEGSPQNPIGCLHLVVYLGIDFGYADIVILVQREGARR